MKKKPVVLICVCGGSGSGKTTVTEEITKIFPNNFKLLHLCLDSFYIKNLSEIKQNKLHTNINFDHPNSFDWELIRETINNLLNRKEVKIPIYDYVNSKRSEQFNTVKNIDVIIFEGFLSLYDNYINDKAAIKIFVDTPDDERFIRRFLRDTKQRGRETENIIQQWRDVVRPMYRLFVSPQKANADLVIPWYKFNKAAIQALNASIKELTKIRKR